MAKQDVIEMEGVVEKVYPGTTFDVKLTNGLVINCLLYTSPSPRD